MRERRASPPRFSRASFLRFVTPSAITCAAFFALASPAEASPWLPAPGHFYLELRETLDTTAQGFEASGARHTLRANDASGDPVASRLYDAQTRLYAEVGLATRLAVVASFTLLRDIVTTAPATRGQHANGVGDLDAGFRLQLVDEEVAVALEATLGMPTGRADGPQPLGTGDLRGRFVLSIGHVGEQVPFYVSVDLGAEVRTSGRQRASAAGVDAPVSSGMTSAVATPVEVDYASELVYALTVGYAPRLPHALRLFAHADLDGRYGTRAPAVLPQPIDPIAPASLRYVRLGAGLGLEKTTHPRRRASPGSGPALRVLVQLSGGAFVWGEGLPAAADISLSLGVTR